MYVLYIYAREIGNILGIFSCDQQNRDTLKD